MGKASRNRRQRRIIPGFPDYPYADAFTDAEIRDILARKDQLVSYFRDALKPDGTIIGIDEGSLQLLMLHGAMAGITVDDALAVIRPKRLPDETGRFVDSVEWVVKRYDTPAARRDDAEEEARRRKHAMDVQVAQMSPEARSAFDRLFRPAAQKAFTAAAQHEQRRRDAATDETHEARNLRAQANRLREEGKL